MSFIDIVFHVSAFASTVIICLLVTYQLIFTAAGYVLHRRSGRQRERLLQAYQVLPPVTVLIPAHNEGKVIAETVHSLLEQDYPPDKLSLLVIDDASTDDTPGILDALCSKHPQVRVLHRLKHEGGNGKSAALNAALPLVHDDYIAIFDADNRPEPGAIRHLVAQLLDVPTLSAAVGKFRTGNKYRNLLTRSINLEGLLFQNIVQSGRWLLFGIASLTGTNYVIRRDVLTQLGGWDEKALTEDTELSVRIYQAGHRIAFVPYASSWEQEPETAVVWLKQRTRWARGNHYAVLKLLRNFNSGGSKLISLEMLFSLGVPYLFLAGIITCHLTGALMLLNPSLAQGLILPGHFWIAPLVLFVVELLLALSYDRETSPSNLAIGVLMFFFYSYAWLIVITRALHLDIIHRKKPVWDKTIRFDSAIEGWKPISRRFAEDGPSSEPEPIPD
ncbi:MAG: glycosyltransferase family 2 protein [bacterium]